MSSSDLAGRARVADDPQALTRLEGLLMRYPDLRPDENVEVGDLLKRTGPLDMGLLSANAIAFAKAEQYRIDHPAVFRTSWKGWLFRLTLVLAVVLTVLLLHDIAV